jgi:hypothetical protein
VAACVSCGFESAASFRFCPECGAAQEETIATGEQRRTVTVAFCDLEGSTALGDGEWVALGREQWPSSELAPRMLSRQVEERVHAGRGEHVEAERLAREAVALGDESDMLNAQGDAYLDPAEVLRLAGKTDEARNALREALARYERKGNLVMAQRTETKLTGLC